MSESITIAKDKLKYALSKGRSEPWCLSLWSKFIRSRDAYRCVNCKSEKQVQAHHIFRKTIYAAGRFELGNGITLCRTCHGKIHSTFNGKPLPGEPLNARGGDDQDEMAFLYGLLVDDANERRLDHDEYYFISDDMLAFFNNWQKHDALLKSTNISRLRKAHELWRNMPLPWYENLANELCNLLLLADLHRYEQAPHDAPPSLQSSAISKRRHLH